MKKTITKVALIATLSLSTGVLLAQTAHATEGVSTTGIALKSSVVVNTYEELATALKDVSISEIIVNNNITFPKAITGVPARNVRIYGSKDKAITINLGKYWIKGNSIKNSDSNAVMTLENANIVGYRKLATFLKGEKGWDFVSKNNDFNGESLVQLNNGHLTFEGTNNMDAEDEIGWVNHVTFAENSVLNGVAANSGHDRSAFRFKGTYANGYGGIVTLEDNSEVNLEVKNKARAAFNGKVNKVNIGTRAILNINTDGTAIEFEKSSLHKTNPEFNVGESAIVSVKSNGEAKVAKPAISFKQPGSQFNMASQATVNIIGTAATGVIESAKDTNFNFDNAARLVVENETIGSPVFSTKQTFATSFNISGDFLTVNAWDKQTVRAGSWDILSNTTFNVNKGATSTIVSDFEKFVEEFKVENYGKIVIENGGF
ncbi:pectate lyase-like adhesive domain-containing protein [Carnobacterium gallinarum]|uniref:pectate lyase-like adhesive domain-containing protein n=1 Tax=Carnobacterium gallinarum TaxID=2749 RepID=UPI0005579303|nr:pectate lyase-like adhesive domain-containing protein [Carnobacterium gallinarum]